MENKPVSTNVDKKSIDEIVKLLSKNDINWYQFKLLFKIFFKTSFT